MVSITCAKHDSTYLRTNTRGAIFRSTYHYRVQEGPDKIDYTRARASEHLLLLVVYACLSMNVPAYLPWFRALSSKPCPGARCKMIGAMPSDFMVFEVSEQPKAVFEEDEEPAATADGNASKWDVNHR